MGAEISRRRKGGRWSAGPCSYSLAEERGGTARRSSGAQSHIVLYVFEVEKSKSEIRRLIKGNAIKLNDEIISDEKLIISDKFFQKDYLKLSIGKKRHIKIEFN